MARVSVLHEYFTKWKLEDEVDVHGPIVRDYTIPGVVEDHDGPRAIEFEDGCVKRYEWDGGDIVVTANCRVESKKSNRDGEWIYAYDLVNYTDNKTSTIRYSYPPTWKERLTSLIDRCNRCHSTRIDGRCFTCEKAERIINNPDLRQVYQVSSLDPQLKKWWPLIRAIKSFYKERA